MILLRSRENLIFRNMHFPVAKAFVLLHIISSLLHVESYLQFV